MDRNGVTTSDRSWTAISAPPSATYWDLDADGYVSDDERDEDADGLTNYDETTDRCPPTGGRSCYTAEGAYPIKYAGTKAIDADSDGDGILDGADDQDFDDVPNIMELSRNMAGNTPIPGRLRRHRRSRPAPADDVGAAVQPVPPGPLLAHVPAAPGDRTCRTPPFDAELGSATSSTELRRRIVSRARTVRALGRSRPSSRRARA